MVKTGEAVHDLSVRLSSPLFKDEHMCEINCIAGKKHFVEGEFSPNIEPSDLADGKTEVGAQVVEECIFFFSGQLPLNIEGTNG